MTLQEAINNADLLAELEAKKERLQDWIDGLKDGLKEFMDEQGETSMLLGTHRVSYKDVTTPRFDSKSFKEKHADLYKQFEVFSTSKRFNMR